MKISSFETGSVLFALAIMGVGFWGWVLNIIKLCGMNIDPLTTMFVMRLVGIFVAPLGSILGLFA